MKHYLNKGLVWGKWVAAYLQSHVKISVTIILILVAAMYYYEKNKVTAPVTVTQHVQVVQKDLSLTLSASGQVSALQSVDLKAKQSGDVVYVGVVQGDKVQTGKVLVSLDARDAQKAVRDAALSVQQAQLDLDKAKQPSQDSDVLSVQAAIKDAQAQKVQNAQTVARAYSTLLNTGLTPVPTNQTYYDTSFPVLSGTYNGTVAGTLTIDASQQGNGTIFFTTGIATTTGTVSTSVAQPIGDTGLYIKFAGVYYTTRWVVNIPNPTAAGYLSAYSSYMSAVQSQIDGDASADRTIAQQTAKLATLKRGTDPLDIQAKQLVLEQKQNMLFDAKQNLADYSATALFPGVAASIPVHKGDFVSSGTTLATLISPTQIVQISVNEVDIPKIKIGQEARITLDALDGVTLKGRVIEADTIGTVTSGVVTYKVKIAFDTVDDRIKPNMTVNADVLVGSSTQALVVPLAALKEGRGGIGYYVEQESTANGTTTVNRVPVTVGLQTDTEAEILSGLSLGDDVVIRKKSTTATTAKTTTAPSLFSAPRGARGG
jgi:HlyD family secretion protein